MQSHTISKRFFPWSCSQINVTVQMNSWQSTTHVTRIVWPKKPFWTCARPWSISRSLKPVPRFHRAEKRENTPSSQLKVRKITFWSNLLKKKSQTVDHWFLLDLIGQSERSNVGLFVLEMKTGSFLLSRAAVGVGLHQHWPVTFAILRRVDFD